MKRLRSALGVALLGLGLFSPSAIAGDDDVAALMLSAAMPGAGEWYNAGYSGGFPILECLVGSICPCVKIASIIDATAGKTDDGMRFDFWASPN